ncbi:MAG: P-II family nitrogen regulator [Ignavibacteria bacterium]|nr:P-II family nitrogen regulator [Ignavibacteria bacterium]MCC7159121.1 P-II family nitrogen regulator [Ignavibacteria bacterium]
MKLIKAFVKSFKVLDILDKLKEEGVEYVCVVDEVGALKFLDDLHSNFSSELGEKVSKIAVISVICENDKADKFINMIKSHAHTGNSGDGIIILENIETYLLI